MKEKISAMVDGELGPAEQAGPYAALGAEGEAHQAWREYHLIGDAMRDTRPLSAGFSARVAQRIAAEPTVLSPKRRAPHVLPALSMAASAAAVALVGVLWFQLQGGAEAPVAKAPDGAQVAAQKASAKEAAVVQPPDSADDYLLAHQGSSPRMSLQGVAPYVRTVSGDRQVRR